MQEILKEIIVVSLTSGIAALLKMYSDIRVLKKDMNQAFTKLREIDAAKVQDPAVGSPACRYPESQG